MIASQSVRFFRVDFYDDNWNRTNSFAAGTDKIISVVTAPSPVVCCISACLRKSASNTNKNLVDLARVDYLGKPNLREQEFNVTLSTDEGLTPGSYKIEFDIRFGEDVVKFEKNTDSIYLVPSL